MINDENILEGMLDFLNNYNDAMSFGAIGEFKSNECDEFFKKCVGNISSYVSLVEGRIGINSFKTYLLNDYVYIVSENSCIGIDMDLSKESRKLKLFRLNGDCFYDYSLDSYTNEVVLKQIIGDSQKITEVILPVSDRILSNNNFVSLIGMNIPNQYFSNECREVLASSKLYQSKLAIECETEDGKITVNTKSYWTSLDKFSSKQMPSIIEFDLVMPNKFQKSMFVLGDDGEYVDLYNYSGLSLTYGELVELLSSVGISVCHTDEFIAMSNAVINIPDKLCKLCRIVNIAKIAKEEDIEVNFSNIGEEE